MPDIVNVQTNTVIVGAGPAGLAVGACLRKAGVPFLIFEQGNRVGSTWTTHYDRLHLHTDNRHSALPDWPWPDGSPRYPSRQQVLDYLEGYAAHFKLEPRLCERVTSATRRDGAWLIRTEDASTGERTYEAANLVVASGRNREPNRPSWPGQETYQGQVIHSADYRNGSSFAGRSVLVVGLGNSGGEIALDLYEHGARPTLSVRSPVNIISREILGLPFLYFAIPMHHLPSKLADRLAAPIGRFAAGDRTRLGLPRPPYGPNTQIRDLKKVPLIDIGTVDLIRKGKIRVRPDIACFTASGVQFTDGSTEDFDGVILATGYRAAVNTFLGGVDGTLDQTGAPVRRGPESGVAGLYFCGFYVSPTGMLREIALEARQIASAIGTSARIAQR